MTSAIAVPPRDLINYPPEFNDQVIAALTVTSSEITALQGTAGALDWKNSVLCATTGALAANTRTGNVLTADANGALGAIDGITPVAGNRILVKNEATQANNGIYDVTNAGAAGAPWVLTRSSDADESAEVTPNLAVMVERGTSNQDKTFVLDINGPVVLNTTALVFDDWRGLAITAPADVTKAAAAVGTSTTVARSDHKHDVSTAAPGAIAIGDAAAEGVATSLARSDHTHSLAAPAAPADVTKAAADAGVATAPARADHKHDVSTAAPGAVAIGDAAAEGVATSLARSDHTHSVAAAAPATIGTANAEGAAATFARSDHVHDHGAQTTDTHHALAVAGVSHGFLSSTDKAKLDTIQTGTATLVLGTIAVATANITASSNVQVTHGALNGSTAIGILSVTSITPGTPGSFTITAHVPASAATETNDVSDVLWKVTN